MESRRLVRLGKIAVKVQLHHVRSDTQASDLLRHAVAARYVNDHNPVGLYTKEGRNRHPYEPRLDL